MKLIAITLSIAVVMTSCLAVVSRSPEIHSTAGIWLALPNLPGVIAWALAAHLSSRTEWLDGFLGYLIIALVDWVAYFGLAELAVFTRRKIPR